MARSRYIVGIDLGTTNCAVAYVDTQGRERPSADIRDFRGAAARRRRPRRRPGRCCRRSSTCPASTSCRPARPGCPGTSRPTGSSASSPGSRGRRSPAAWSASAKSWLCHPGIDREADILPWGSPPEIRKVSPVEASAAYLAPHPRRLERQLRRRRRGAPARAAGGRPDGPGVVRRGRARADARRPPGRRGWRTSPCSRSRRRRSTAGSSRTRTAGSARSGPAS